MLSVFWLGFSFVTRNWEKKIVLLVCLVEALLAEAEMGNTPLSSRP